MNRRDFFASAMATPIMGNQHMGVDPSSREGSITRGIIFSIPPEVDCKVDLEVFKSTVREWLAEIGMSHVEVLITYGMKVVTINGEKGFSSSQPPSSAP